jgi:hypothetical protein
MPAQDAQQVPDLPVPVCVLCDAATQVEPLSVTAISESIHYWRCTACGPVWATREGAPLPVKSA